MTTPTHNPDPSPRYFQREETNRLHNVVLTCGYCGGALNPANNCLSCGVASPNATTLPIAISQKLPALGPKSDFSFAIYPDPPSHDFLTFAVIAELMRRYHGAPAPLKIRFVLYNGQLGLHDFSELSLATQKSYPLALSREYSDIMLANVLRPAIAMLGAVELPLLHSKFPLTPDLQTHVEFDYHIRFLVDAARQGYTVPKWTPPLWAWDEVNTFLAGRKPVVITLRESEVQPERNSQTVEWLRFAQSIQDKHYVLFVRDTAKAYEPFQFQVNTYPRASTNAHIRAALYQRALVNMFVCNGPMMWAVFSDAPYLIFKQLIPALPHWDHGQAKGWRDQEHMDIGDQYPWAQTNQHLTWTDDTFDNITQAFNQFLKDQTS